MIQAVLGRMGDGKTLRVGKMVIHCIVEKSDGKILFRTERPKKIEQVFLGLSFAQASGAFRRFLSSEFGGSVRSLGGHKCGAGLRSVSYEVGS